MNTTGRHAFPTVHYYDQDIVALYDHSWHEVLRTLDEQNTKNKDFVPPVFDGADSDPLSLFSSLISVFFLSYLPNNAIVANILDFFYEKQEENGAIRGEYDKTTGEPLFSPENPEGLCPPIIAWAEFNYFNHTDNKQRLKKVLPKLDKYLTWIQSVALGENGLFTSPLSASHMNVSSRQNAHYLIDFNAQMAIAYNYMNVLATYVNNRHLNFKYAKAFYQLKSSINEYFWNGSDNFYYDLDKYLRPIPTKTIASFWTLLGKIPNNLQARSLVEYLKDPDHFGSTHPFPTLAVSEPKYNRFSPECSGSVHPIYTYMVVKGLALYEYHEFARESALKHIYSVFETLIHTAQEDCPFGAFLKTYDPEATLPEKPSDESPPEQKNFITVNATSIIALMIENTIGIDICAPKKIAQWVVPHLETLGIEGIHVRRNLISTIIQRTSRGWSIKHSSEKLYYFSIHALGINKQRTMPIPSGRCSMILEKL